MHVNGPYYESVTKNQMTFSTSKQENMGEVDPMCDKDFKFALNVDEQNLDNLSQAKCDILQIT